MLYPWTSRKHNPIKPKCMNIYYKMRPPNQTNCFKEEKL